MLRIQRASAGSGKTYALTKNFILNLIGNKNEKGEWRLNAPKEIEDKLSKILAITFTNKATNEMKERIVAKLADLAKAATLKITPRMIENTDYLEDFHRIFNAEYKQIGLSASHALRIILNDYSRFRISTIDSFFQEILRTFAYEVNLNDTYQLEIDSEFLSASALDSTLNDFERKEKSNANVKFWLKEIMRREGEKSQRWNVFQKSEKSIYSGIKKSLKQLDSEEYKSFRERLATFFESPDAAEKIQKLYLKLKLSGEEQRTKALIAIRNKAKSLQEELLACGIKESELNRFFIGHLDKIRTLTADSKIPFQYGSILKDGSVFKKAFRNDSNAGFDIKALEFYEMLDGWSDPSKNSEYWAWKIYGELFPYFGIILEVGRRQSEIMLDENLIKLSDTSELLKRIIGDDDVPYIYERLGSHIQNYLIDEFQDTSQMQWDVLKPLVAESEATGNDNLIIGDPKQSIYRFRNANHQLIMSDVPYAFPGHMSLGMSQEENTNYRSKRRIVQFNNLFFSVLASLLQDLSREKGNGTNINAVYSNVAQLSKEKNEGYVEINFINKDESSSENEVADDEESDLSRLSWYDNLVLPMICKEISKLISRGYRQKDIGILVAKKIQGKKIIDALIRYNESNTENSEPIRFISEESLLLSSSPAVELIINVFEKLASGIGRFNVDSRKDSQTTEREPKIPWNRVKTDFRLFSLLHPDLSGAECLTLFLKNRDEDGFLKAFMGSIETPSIPAVIEAVAGELMPAEMRDSQAIYLAALQDAVNENAHSFNNDAASFLEWWRLKGKEISVSSPEDVDAVQLMTVHKSKGLEFKCVILPYALEDFIPTHKTKEWKWVRPCFPFADNTDIPCLPIMTSSALEGTWHQDIYREYVDHAITDVLNMYYVAFTRARNELYIYSKQPSKKGNTTLGGFLNTIIGSAANFLESMKSAGEENLFINLSELNTHQDGAVITVGEKLSDQSIRKEYDKINEKEAEDKESQPKSDIHEIADYYVRKTMPRLKFKVTDKSDFED